ncbi:cupin domain-containing protein [Halobacillus litoralis]|uniref:cupin domain-containing protein n=1 Tax=Halobacillus litoralis TaxID=45668 RepID=UPI001CFDC2EE|nr:cupin domain-containing protein [Halobacillus litoralis]
MYFNPHTYLGNASSNTRSSITRSSQDNHQQISEKILAAIKGKAESSELYSRLVNHAPNEQHQQEIIRTWQEENAYLQEFSRLYTSMTGSPPSYSIEPMTCDTYEEGIQRAYESELKNYENDQKMYHLAQSMPISNVFSNACQTEVEHANRFQALSTQINRDIHLEDYGKKPYVVNIDKATIQNDTYRTAIWTGEHLQVTLMSIGVGDDIGLEVHPDVDQFLRIEQGQGIVQMGDKKNQLDFVKEAYEDSAIMVPAGKWHNLTNTGDRPLKLYSIYAPPEHPFGTVHKTKADAVEAEE